MEQKELKPIVIDGVEYITKSQLAKRTGYTVDGLHLKVKKLNIKPLKLPNGRVLFPLKDIEEAESRGKFYKYL